MLVLISTNVTGLFLHYRFKKQIKKYKNYYHSPSGRIKYRGSQIYRCDVIIYIIINLAGRGRSAY